MKDTERELQIHQQHPYLDLQKQFIRGSKAHNYHHRHDHHPRINRLAAASAPAVTNTYSSTTSRDLCYRFTGSTGRTEARNVQPQSSTDRAQPPYIHMQQPSHPLHSQQTRQSQYSQDAQPALHTPSRHLRTGGWFMHDRELVSSARKLVRSASSSDSDSSISNGE